MYAGSRFWECLLAGSWQATWEPSPAPTQKWILSTPWVNLETNSPLSLQKGKHLLIPWFQLCKTQSRGPAESQCAWISDLQNSERINESWDAKVVTFYGIKRKLIPFSLSKIFLVDLQVSLDNDTRKVTASNPVAEIVSPSRTRLNVSKRGGPGRTLSYLLKVDLVYKINSTWEEWDNNKSGKAQHQKPRVQGTAELIASAPQLLTSEWDLFSTLF